MVSRTLGACLALASALLATGCGDASVPLDGGTGGGPADTPPTPWPVTEFPALPSEALDVPDARIRLGNLLFYDPILSIDRETACATCHSEFWGMSDALPLAVGNGAGPLAGPGREGPNTLRRNSPALFNLAYRETLLLDGRAETLEEQALMPLEAEDELNLTPEAAVAELMAIPEYVALFEEAFPDDPRVTTDHLASALAAFQRTFVSDRAVYDAYVQGDAAAMSEEEVDGMFRFAEMGCNDCHAPPLFESERFANRRAPGADGTDEGRAEVTGDPEDAGKFRVPSLRNAFDTKPYFHNGSVDKLDDAVRHELEQSGMPFDETDVAAISGFINRSLRDDSRQADRPQTLPSGLPTPLDGPVFPGR
ncbi:MAG: cytochrome c peroxidase [Myxococcota bacterium]